MKVFYDEKPGTRTGHPTTHPELGVLIPGDVFDLPHEVAKKYLKSGLLEKAEGARQKAEGCKAEGTRHKAEGLKPNASSEALLEPNADD